MKGTYKYGWHEETESSKADLVYSGSFEALIKKTDATVIINGNGSITSTQTNLYKEGWGKPYTTTNAGGPVYSCKISQGN